MEASVSHLNLELYKQVDDLRRADERQQARRWRLSRHLSARLPARRQQSWLSRQGCWLLCQLGRRMVNLGRQLQQVGLSNATS
jgi:hypothetical protein